MSEKRKVNRPKRSRIELKNKLSAKPREGYVRRWVNESNFEDRHRLGYRPVDGDEDMSQNLFQDASKQGSSMVSRTAGGGQRTILMEIPLEEYEDLRNQYDEEVNSTESGIMRENNDDPNIYGSIKIEHKK